MDNVRGNDRPPPHLLERWLRKVLVAVIRTCAECLHPAVLQRMVLNVGVQLGREEAAAYRLAHAVNGRFDIDACARCLAWIGRQIGWHVAASIESDSVIRIDEWGCEAAKLGEPNPYLTELGYGILGGVAADEFGYAKVCVTHHPEKPPFHRTIRIYLQETRESQAEPGIVFPKIVDETASLTEQQLRVIPTERLTPRETEVFTLIAQGLSDKQIAAKLRLSVRTVQNHAAQVRHKLGVGNRAALVRLALGAPVGDMKKI